MRRTLIIVASIIVVIGIAALVYFLFFAKGSPQLTADTNPFGNTGAGDASGGSADVSGGSGSGTAVGQQIAPSFVQITDKPVAKGFVALFIPPQTISTPSTTSTSTDLSQSPRDIDVRYIDRASGNVYSYHWDERILTRLSNKTLPGIQRAAWLPNGSMAFAQYLSRDDAGTEHVETYALPAGGEGGYFLERDLDQVAVSTTSVFSLLSSGSGSTGTTAKPDGSAAKTVFSSVLSSITAGFAGKGFIAYTKPSGSVPGYGFTVDGAGAFTRVLGPLNGLSMLASPSGASVLYSYTDRGALRLAILDVGTHEITTLPIATLAEKCVWAPDNHSIYCAVPTTVSGTLPDDWYQGAVSFSDRIWRIDLTSRVTILLVDPNAVASKKIDAVGLTTDSKSDVLVFMNKKDGSLYAYDL